MPNLKGVDYRAILTKKDILTMRRALREAICMCAYAPNPELLTVERVEFETLLKKIKGAHPQQTTFGFPRSQESANCAG